MSETHTYIPDEGLIADMILKEREEIEDSVDDPQTGSQALRKHGWLFFSGRTLLPDAVVKVAQSQPYFHAGTWDVNVCIAQGTAQIRTNTLADEKSITVKLPPNDSDTIRRLFVSLDEDDESGDESDSASEELIRLIESLGKPALEFLGTLIEDSVSYTNSFLALELLGFIEQKSTRVDRVDIALRMLSNRRAPVRQAAIGVLATLRAEEALEYLESLALSDSSTLNRKLAQRAIERISAPRWR